MMFYAVNIKCDEGDGKVHFTVGLVYAEGLKEAMKKANKLFGERNILEIELRPMPDEWLERAKSAYGGIVIAEFEEYTE